MITLELAPGHTRYMAPDFIEKPRTYRDRTQPLPLLKILTTPMKIVEMAAALDAQPQSVQKLVNRLLDSNKIVAIPGSWPRQYRKKS